MVLRSDMPLLVAPTKSWGGAGGSAWLSGSDANVVAMSLPWADRLFLCYGVMTKLANTWCKQTPLVSNKPTSPGVQISDAGGKEQKEQAASGTGAASQESARPRAAGRRPDTGPRTTEAEPSGLPPETHGGWRRQKRGTG